MVRPRGSAWVRSTAAHLDLVVLTVGQGSGPTRLAGTSTSRWHRERFDMMMRRTRFVILENVKE